MPSRSGGVLNAAVSRGWPEGLAMQYLTLYLKFDVGPRQLEAISRFHELASTHGKAAAWQYYFTYVPAWRKTALIR